MQVIDGVNRFAITLLGEKAAGAETSTEVATLMEKEPPSALFAAAIGNVNGPIGERQHFGGDVLVGLG